MQVSAPCQRRQPQLGPASAAPGALSVMTNAIVAEALTKRFGPVTAVAGIDLQVKEGTVFGLLGPNGAGKTTTVHILATLVTPDAGHPTIAGYDVATQPHQVRQLIGLASSRPASTRCSPEPRTSSSSPASPVPRDRRRNSAPSTLNATCRGHETGSASYQF